MMRRRWVTAIAAGAGATVIAGAVTLVLLAGNPPGEVLAPSLLEVSGTQSAGVDDSMPVAHPAPGDPAMPDPPDVPDPPVVPVVPTALSSDALAALPEARYDSVIVGLLGEPSQSSQLPAQAYSLDSRVALYGSDRSTPIATLPAVNFLGEPTVIVPVEVERGWARILTPARQSLPSANGGSAPAQTSAWIAKNALRDARPLSERIIVSVSAGTLTILKGERIQRVYTVAVGTEETPTPTGVTGYLQARYLDPAQNQTVHPVQLTSLHSAHADEPYGGSDGGLIGLHYSNVARGSVSHGCVRLDADAITAINALPLGTPITIDP